MKLRFHPRTACALIVPCLTGCAGPAPYDWGDVLYQRIVDHPDAPPTVRDAEALDADTSTTAAAYRDVSFITNGSLTAEDAVRIAIRNHPEMRRLAYLVGAASARESQAQLPPNPSFAFVGEALGSRAGRGGETAYLLEQEFVTAGKRKKAGAVAESDRIEAQAEFLAMEFEIATQVRLRFVHAVAADRRRALQRELVDLSNELLSAAQARMEAGAATESERLRAEVVAEQAAIDLATAEASCEAARAALAAAIGIDHPIEGPLGDDLEHRPELPDRAEVVEVTLHRNQRIDQAKNAIERAQRAHELAKANATPNVVVAIGPRYSDPESETTLDVGASIAIPAFDRNQGEIAATLAERISAGAALGSVKLELIKAVSAAWGSYATARATIDAYERSLLPKSERTLALTREAYEAGKTDYLRLLDAQQSYVRSQSAFVDALEAAHEAAAILDGLMQRDTPWRDSLTNEEDHNS